MRVRLKEWPESGNGVLQIVSDDNRTLTFAVCPEAPEDACFGRNLPRPEDVAAFFGIELEIIEDD